MMKSTFTSAFVALGVAAMPGSAQATLHGFCAGVGQCVDNGTNSPTASNPPVSFGFTTAGGPTTGDLFLDILAHRQCSIRDDIFAYRYEYGNSDTVLGDALDFRPA